MVYLRKSLTATWKQELGNLTDTIIFIEENNRFIQRSDFTKFVKESGNYFVFINRKALKMLPYSVTEIYRLQNEYSEEEKKQVYTLVQDSLRSSALTQQIFNGTVQDPKRL